MVKDVTVLLSNIPVDEPLEDLAANIHLILNTDEVGTFRVREFTNNGVHRKVLLDFDSGYDAMPAQELLHKYDYAGADGEIYRFTAKVTHNPAHLPKIELRHAIEEVALEPPEKKLKEGSRIHFLDSEVDLHQSNSSRHSSRNPKSDRSSDRHRSHEHRYRDHSKLRDQNERHNSYEFKDYRKDAEKEKLEDEIEIISASSDDTKYRSVERHQSRHSHSHSSRNPKSDRSRDRHRRHKRKRKDHSKSKDPNERDSSYEFKHNRKNEEEEKLKEENEIIPDNKQITFEKSDDTKERICVDLHSSKHSHRHRSRKSKSDRSRDRHRRHKHRRRDHSKSKEQNEIHYSYKFEDYIMDSEEKEIKEENEITPDNINIKLEKPDDNLVIAESIHLNESIGVEVKQEKQQSEIAELINYRKDEEEEKLEEENQIIPDNINIKLEKPDKNLDIAESIHLNESMCVAVKQEKQQSDIAEFKYSRKNEEEEKLEEENEITPDNINIKLEKPDENLVIAVNLNESMGVAVKQEKQQSKIAEQFSVSNIKTEPRSRSPSPDSDKTVIVSSKLGQKLEEDLDEYDMNDIIDKYAVTNAALTSSVKIEPGTKSPTLNINRNTTDIKQEPLSRSPSPDVRMNKITLSFTKEDLLKSLDLVKDEPNTGDDLWVVVEEALQDFSTDLLQEEES